MLTTAVSVQDGGLSSKSFKVGIDKSERGSGVVCPLIKFVVGYRASLEPIGS